MYAYELLPSNYEIGSIPNFIMTTNGNGQLIEDPLSAAVVCTPHSTYRCYSHIGRSLGPRSAPPQARHCRTIDWDPGPRWLPFPAVVQFGSARRCRRRRP